MLLLEKTYSQHGSEDLVVDVVRALDAALPGPARAGGRFQVQVHWVPDDNAQAHHDAVYQAVVERDGHWPAALTSGVMYRRGVPITRAEFLAVARSGGFPRKERYAA